jgi:VanZ family protein
MSERPPVRVRDPQRPPVSTRLWWAGFFTMVALALHFTRLAYREGLPEFLQTDHVDKLVHFTFAGLLAFFLDGALRRRQVLLGRSSVPLAALVILVPTAIEEFLQRYSIHRTSSIWDFVADVAGVFALIPLSRRIAR